jgi:hypothetical protein
MCAQVNHFKENKMAFQTAATSIAVYVAKEYSSTALQFLKESLSSPFWKSNLPDACQVVREEVKQIVPVSEIQAIYALLQDCANLRGRSALIHTLLTNLNDEAAKIHHELHLIRLAILDYQEPMSRRPYYGLFSLFSHRLDVSSNLQRMKEASVELHRNFRGINEWIQTGIALDIYNRKVPHEIKTMKTTESDTTLSQEIEGKTTISSPNHLNKFCLLSSLQTNDPNMIDKMSAITRLPSQNDAEVIKM